MIAPVNQRGRFSGIPHQTGSRVYPGELLCEFVSGSDRFRIELRHHELWGVEARVFRRGLFLRARRFYTRELAVQWALNEREALLRKPSE
ncbi:MAG TPA: hypothetical protein VKE96_15850 [Vicinamibacterales bacterium]|nr:hypothetical protein [Vicinamibacterales bacterium]